MADFADHWQARIQAIIDGAYSIYSHNKDDGDVRDYGDDGGLDGGDDGGQDDGDDGGLDWLLKS